MRLPLIALLVATLLLPACGGGLRDSRLNPANWFGRSTSVETAPGTVRTADGQVEEVNPLIGERRQSKMIPANRRVHNDSGSIFNRKKTEIYEGTRIDRVTDLEIERTSTGAIVRATGISARQGAFDVRLLPLNDAGPVDGVLTYEFLAMQPINTPQGPERLREIQVAQPLGNTELAEVRTIRVIARHNTRQTSR